MTIFNFLLLIIENRAMLREKESVLQILQRRFQNVFSSNSISVWKSKLVPERTLLIPFSINLWSL